MTQLSLLPDSCYCCGGDATQKAGRSLRWDLCDGCEGACFRRIRGEIRFVCPKHGKMEPIELEGVRWYKKDTWKHEYPVKVKGGKKLWLLDWHDIRSCGNAASTNVEEPVSA